jgi:hypothetical protein
MSDETKRDEVSVDLDKYTDLIMKLDEANDKIAEMEKLRNELKVATIKAKPEAKFTFGALFRDDNNINEKNIIGFASFLMMVSFGIVDLITGLNGMELVIDDAIYTSFVVVTLGSFGIAEAGKAFGK